MKIRRPRARISRTPGRRGATLVETALAIPIALLLMFGIFEYGRYVMMRNVLANAAREGARLAVIHTHDLATADIQNQVMNYLGGQQYQVQNLTIQVYPTDANGNAVAGGDWTATPFGSCIGVQIDADYQPVLPSFLMMPNMVHLETVAVMTSEGN
ncbi:MAG: pilus assembly protein [Planctomycetes bacterium]|nr:pilus assembly protein [Planctomycetota bacterium]